MKRRQFITLLVGTATTWPLAARAQQPAVPVIGFLGSTSRQGYEVRLRAFARGLKEEGYVENQNVRVEYRWAEDDDNRLPMLAAELVQRKVAVIAAGGSPSSLAAKAATATIPIVFETATDPVTLGLVASLNRPGGNLTGVTNLNIEVGQKKLELLRELLPSATTIAVLVNPSSPAVTEQFTRSLQSAAHNPRNGAPGYAGEHGSRLGYGLCNNASGRARHRPLFVFQFAHGTAWRTVVPTPRACNLFVSPVRCGRRPDELRSQ